MILVDTSVWVGFFRQSDSFHSQMLDQQLADKQVIVGDLIAAEILQGVKGGKEERLVAGHLLKLPTEELCGMDIALRAAENYRRLRATGITVRGTIDVIIATWCVENQIALLHNDRDFSAMEQLLGLQSVAQPS